jgi:hypothetical protein
MTKSIRDITKKRGRPKTTGRGTIIGTRWHEAELDAIDAWSSKHPDKPPRVHALRMLVERGLKVPVKE